MNIIESAFRDAMRRLPATVTILSTGNGKMRHGITATAVSSLSLDPPSLLVCVNRASSFHPMLNSCGGFCVNVLKIDQVDISNAFSGKLAPEDRFEAGKWRIRDTKMPYLEGAQSNIFCKTQQTMDFGSHTILVGLVTDIIVDDDVSSLVYADGKYCTARPIDIHA